MSPSAFRALLDAYVRAAVDYEFCHMNGYDQKLKRLNIIKDKIMSVYYESRFWDNKQHLISLEKRNKILKNSKGG